jgi:hypothetical protein
MGYCMACVEWHNCTARGYPQLQESIVTTVTETVTVTNEVEVANKQLSPVALGGMVTGAVFFVAFVILILIHRRNKTAHTHEQLHQRKLTKVFADALKEQGLHGVVKEAEQTHPEAWSKEAWNKEARKEAWRRKDETHLNCCCWPILSPPKPTQEKEAQVQEQEPEGKKQASAEEQVAAEEQARKSIGMHPGGAQDEDEGGTETGLVDPSSKIMV